MLSGLRIVEFEGLGPGPFAAMMLADLGADVIVVHRARAGAAGPEDGSVLDRGKRSVVLDLKDDGDLELAKTLVARADGLIEGNRPGVMERLGLGPEVCLGLNPALAYGRMTGWGQDGPRARQAGHDLNYIGLSGALHYAGLPGDAPVTPATLVGDIGGGALYLVAGMLAVMLRAQRDGEGAVVDAAIVDGSAHMMALVMALAQAGQMGAERGQNLLDGPHWSRSYACADGRFVTVQCLEPKFYAEFLELMGLAGDSQFAHQHEAALWSVLGGRLAGIFASKPQAHWTALFDGTDACAGPVLSPWEAAEEAHMAARGVWQAPGGVLQPAPAPRFDGQRAEAAAPPTRGQHDAEIRAEAARGPGL